MHFMVAINDSMAEIEATANRREPHGWLSQINSGAEGTGSTSGAIQRYRSIFLRYVCMEN